MTVYHAYYEDVAKLEAEARKAGWTGEDDGSLLDYAEADRCTGRDFKSKAAAANTNEVIRALAGKVQALEARLAERQTQPGPQKAFNDWGRVG